MIKSIELKVAASLLRLASEEFSNHCCNEFNFRKEAKLTDEQAEELIALFNEWNKKENPIDFEPISLNAKILDDSTLMDYLADKLEEGNES